MHIYDEERLGTLLRMLRPAPAGWVQAAQELPAARRSLDEIVARAEADLAFRSELVADLEADARARGCRARPPPRRRAAEASREELSRAASRVRRVDGVLAHSADASGQALPAWSLPKDAVDRIALPSTWPERVTREWAWGESTGEGVRVCILDSGVDGRTSARRRPRERRDDLGRRERRGDGRGGHGGRPLRTRHRLRGSRAHRSPPAARSRACACSEPASRAAEECCSPGSATPSSRGST